MPSLILKGKAWNAAGVIVVAQLIISCELWNCCNCKFDYKEGNGMSMVVVEESEPTHFALTRLN